MSRALRLVAPAGPSEVAPETELLGLAQIRRTVLAAQRAGFVPIIVVAEPTAGALARSLQGTAARIEPAAAAPVEGSVVLEWNRVLRTSEMEALAEGRPADGLGVALRAARDRPRAERWLLDGLVKSSEGFMSRHFERKISLEVSRRLAGTAITPNQMTLVSVAVGLAGAPFFLSARAPMQTAGALLFLLHSILDGCDGELARLKFQESRFGGVLDFWGDNLVHGAIFGCMAAGWSAAIGRSWPLLLGAAAVGGTLASAGFVYWKTMRAPRQGPLFTSVADPGGGAVSRVADALSRRDFIYLVLALSILGKASWFLLAAAVGAPIFFLVLWTLPRRGAERKTT